MKDKLARYERRLFRHEIEKELSKDATKNDVLDFIFGSYNDNFNSDYYVINRFGGKTKTNLIQRINTLWFMPLWVIIVMPIQYLSTGKTGISKDSKFGLAVQWLIGPFS